MNFTNAKESNKLSSRSAYDRESYRTSAHDYDLTQKKKSVYFPSKKWLIIRKKYIIFNLYFIGLNQ